MSRLKDLLIRLRAYTYQVGYGLHLAATLAAIGGLEFFAQQTAQAGLVVLLAAIVSGRSDA
jgi:hypothetical protein